MTTDTPMVERCAQAVYAKSDLGQMTVADAEMFARAVLECLRTPTPEMVDYANENVRPDSDNLQCVAFYQAMIERALSPSKGEGE